MSHLLIALAVLASLSVYPGGLTLLVSALAVAFAFRLGRGRQSARLAPPSLAAVIGAELVVVSLPWPGSPLVELGTLGLAAAPLAAIPVTVLGILWGRPPGSAPAKVMLELGYRALTAALLLGLALFLRSPGWSGVLSAGGLGAIAGRAGVAVVVLLSLPLLAGPPQTASGVTRWAALGALCLFLLAPPLTGWPVPVGLAVWLLGAAALGAVAGLGARAAGAGPAQGLAARAGRIWIP